MLKTNYKTQAKRYETADQYLFSLLPKWKKLAVIECRELKKFDDRLFSDFTKDIIKLAEGDNDIPETSFVDKKSVDTSKKPVTLQS